MFSIAMAFAASFCAIRVLVVGIVGDQTDDEIGGGPAQRDPSHDSQ